LIADAEYFAWIEAESSAILRRETDAVTRLVHRSVEIKAEVVSADERESGRRAALNAGHTVAHALEQLSGYRLAHGEAVALGLIAESELAERLGVAPRGLRGRVAALMARLGLPVSYGDSLNVKAAIAQMGSDKKNRGAQIHCALPAGIGSMHTEGGWTMAVAPEHMEAVLVRLGTPVGASEPIN
jgi:3-dehydroquinate synthetase